MTKCEKYGLIPVSNYRPSEIDEIVEERSRYGVARQDCWNLDGYFFRVLSNGLKIYKEETNGHPYDMTPDEYDKLLEKMIVLCATQFVDATDYFLENLPNNSLDTATNCGEWQVECRKELFELLTKYIGHLWW